MRGEGFRPVRAGAGRAVLSLRLRLALCYGGALVAALAAALVLGARTWHRESARMAARVVASARSAPRRTFQPEALAGLPAPVVRYFEFALRPGQPLVRIARIEHAGEFRTGPDAGWSPFRSVQHFSADPPGFVWDASLDMVPLVGIRVRDGYLGGHAAMLGKVAALVPVVDQEGTPELAAGALHRYLAESAWFPTALLPRDGLTWEAVDDSTARVTLTDAGIGVTLQTHFGPSGEIVRVEAERYRDVAGVGVLTPFVGHFRAYREIHGMQIPMEGEVEWILPEGRFSYWRGQVERLEYRVEEP